MRHPYLGHGHAEEVGGEVGEVLAGEGELGDAGAGQLGQQLTNHSSASSHGPITAHLVQLGPRQLRVVQVEVLGAGEGRHQRGRAHLAV